jgi:hypothetical protein
MKEIRELVESKDNSREYIHSSPTNKLISKDPYVGEWYFINNIGKGKSERR